MKRSIDVVVAIGGLVVLLPVLGIVAFSVLISSGHPVLFQQLRVGKGGGLFSLVKFRTMSILRGSERGAFDAGSTRRVTRVGGVLRKTKLDELPQLWNVLRGEMSLVGPRPEVQRWVEVYPERWARVLTMRPGITDPASILYRNEEEILASSSDPEKTYREEILPRKLDCYEAYVREHTFWGDLRIILKTIKVGVWNRERKP